MLSAPGCYSAQGWLYEAYLLRFCIVNQSELVSEAAETLTDAQQAVTKIESDPIEYIAIMTPDEDKRFSRAERYYSSLRDSQALRTRGYHNLNGHIIPTVDKNPLPLVMNHESPWESCSGSRSDST
jgi:hypothetical protein